MSITKQVRINKQTVNVKFTKGTLRSKHARQLGIATCGKRRVEVWFNPSAVRPYMGRTLFPGSKTLFVHDFARTPGAAFAKLASFLLK